MMATEMLQVQQQQQGPAQLHSKMPQRLPTPLLKRHQQLAHAVKIILQQLMTKLVPVKHLSKRGGSRSKV